MRKEESIGAELAQTVRRAWRHRAGLKVMGKQIIDDNTIPGLVMDTFDNLGFVTKADKLKPKIVRKKETEYGYHLTIHLPPGISYQQCIHKKHFFECATKSFISMSWNGALQMEIQTTSLPAEVNYKWSPPENMILPLPIGISHRGPLTWDLASGAPHMLIGGATNYGKSNELYVIVHSLLMLENVNVCIIDRKEVDFDYLKKHVLVAETEEESLNLLQALWKEHLKRTKILKKEGVKKIQSLSEPPPYIVCIIDEFAQLQDDKSHYLIDSLVRLSRSTGIHVIAATQRPSSKKMDTDTRSQFDLRLCFPVSSEIDSRMILGETNSEAAWLQRIPGRALFKTGMELMEVQTFYLSDKKAQQLLKDVPGRGWDIEQKKLLPR